MPEREDPIAKNDYKPNPERSTNSHGAVFGYIHELKSAEENERKQDLNDEIQKKAGGVHAREKCDKRNIDSQSAPMFFRCFDRQLALRMSSTHARNYITLAPFSASSLRNSER